ncbi:hypothetical protein RJ55_01199 [Drechmeria coniospora]|nr:hypothetical protein RJ55_01199 [Drechmeria coniospora]
MGAPQNDRKRQRSEVEEAVAAAMESQDVAPAPSTKRARVDDKKSLFVRSLPPKVTNESLAEFFSQHFAVKHAVVVMDHDTQESKGYGFVTFADADDASEAKKTLDKAEWAGKRIRVEVAEPRQRNATDGPSDAPPKPGKVQFEKAPKLIIRNLPWSIKTSEQLSHLFRSFGKIKFADLPQSKGKLKGFGFVTIRGKKNAERALEAINGKQIDGRTLAVDWAVDRETWHQQQAKEGDEAQSDEAPTKPADGTDGSDEDASKTSVEEGLNADLENFMKNHMQHMEDEDDDEDDDEDEEDDERLDTGPGQTPPSRRQQSTDNSSTIFVRNLPFTTTDEQLKGFFDNFGKIRYARVVMDKLTAKPAGTGFVCFFNLDDAKSCLKEAPRPKPSIPGAKTSLLLDENVDPSGKYTLDGRLLQVAQAVNREEASTLADSSLAKRREKDKRRLYLLPEGAIPRGSPLAQLLSPSEIQMRQTSAAQRKKLIQSNPSLHVSLTRLAVRNIPRNVGSKELKELARKAIVGFAQDVREGRREPLSKEENARDDKDVKERERQRKSKGKGIVRQAKVVFETNQGSKVSESTGAGKSRGYGFIEYTSHHWSLMGLRYLNGHQVEDHNGQKQRLIVEFAIENAQVVQRRRAAEEKSAQGAKAKEDAVATAAGRVDESKDSVPEKRPKGKKAGRSNKGEARQVTVAKGADKKEEMKQKLIGRKRLMRKKKASSRGKS